MHYQIYLPTSAEKHDGSLERHMAAVGLADHADSAMSFPDIHGPDGKVGQLVGWLSTASGQTRLEYKPAEQTWLKSLPLDGREAGAYWVGVQNDSPPTESQLRRAYTQAGERVQLGEQKWKLPTPHHVDRQAQYNDDGSMKWVPVREFAWLIDEAQQIKEDMIENWGVKQMTFEVEPSEFVHWLLKLLRVNYHLTPEVAAHLNLWRSSHVVEAVLHSLSLSRVEESTDG